jgi:hypothetical protein
VEEDKPLLGHLMWVVGQIAKQLDLKDGYRLVVNDGQHAGKMHPLNYYYRLDRIPSPSPYFRWGLIWLASWNKMKIH